MELIRNYMNDPERRRMLNDLTRRTFYFDFEDWVSGGWFSGDYIPYSLVENGRLLANASANIMTFDQNGERRNYIQIGTVMTDEEYRGRGLARQLVGRIPDDHSGCDKYPARSAERGYPPDSRRQHNPGIHAAAGRYVSVQLRAVRRRGRLPAVLQGGKAARDRNSGALFPGAFPCVRITGGALEKTSAKWYNEYIVDYCRKGVS